MEGNINNNNRMMLGAAVSIILCVLLSNLSLGSLLFTLPLLLFVPKIRKTSYAVLTFVITWVIIVAVTLFNYRSLLNTDQVGVIFFALFFNTAALLGAAVWTGVRDYSDSVLRKLVICSYPIAFLGITCSVLMTLPFAEGFVDGIKLAVESIFNSELLGISAGDFSTMFVTVLVLIAVPIGMVYSGFPILMSEVVLKRSDETWQYNFANMKMPNSFVWILLGAWLLAMFSTIIVLPTWFVSIIWNIALGLSLHYFVSGVSVITAVLRRRSATISAVRVLVPVIILSIIPGINVVVITGLALLGALETWVKLR